MIELKNITFREYVSLEDRTEFDFAIKYGLPFLKPEDVCKIGDFTQLEFGLIKDLQQDISQGIMWDKLLEYMVLITGKSEEYFLNLSIIRIVRFKNYIVSEIQRIVDIEKSVLSYEPSEDEAMAGIDKLSVFGVYNQLLSVARGNPLDIEKARKLKYVDAFVYLANAKASSDFERELMEIRSKPAQ